VLEIALEYVQMGLPIIPICSPDHRGESLKHRQVCAYPGKVPVVAAWQTRTTTSEDEVEKWFSGSHAHRNIGLPLGNASRLIGVDIDGESGEEYLLELSDGDLPTTWEFTTGKGRRLLYRLPQGLKVKKFKKANQNKQHEELALLGDGQQTVIPPSIHQNGIPYQWIPGRSPFEMPEPAEAPEWMLKLMTDPKSERKFQPTVTPEEWTGTVYEGHRQDRLKKLAGSLLGRGTIPKEEVLLFLRAWNEKHCKPPWPDEELVTLVNNLAYAEQAKRASKSQNDKKILRPTPFVQKFLADQREAGYSWRYCVKNGLFYRSDDTVGPWKPIDQQYVQKELRAALLAECEDWDTQHRVNEALNALKEQLASYDSDHLFDIGENPNLDLVCVKNGLVEWETGKLYPWDPETYITTQLDVHYDPKAECPTWLENLCKWVPDEDTRLFLQEYIGLCLIPDTSFRMAVFLYGDGSNGKSLFIEGVSKIFGETMSFIPLHRLAERFETANLLNKLVNVCSDIDPQYLRDTGTLKSIISGDRIKGEYKHGRSFHFTPVARLLFSANELPRARDRSEGWYSRWGFIEFPNHFPRNSAYKKRILTALEKEKAGIFNWALAGLQRLMKDNTFTESRRMQDARREYILTNDNILAFLTEYTEYGPHVDTHIPTKHLYTYYRWFCEENGYQIASSREFVRQLKRHGIDTGSRNVPGNYKKRAHSFLNIKIKEDFERDFNFLINCRGKAI